jgi:hypothetical protein
LKPDAFVSTVDPSTGRCYGGDDPQHCQFGDLGRNALRGPDFFWNDFYLTEWLPVTERVKLRIEAQFFNLFNHPNFGLPCMVLAGVPGKPSTQTGFGALAYTTSPPTGLLGVGLGGDSSPRRQDPQCTEGFAEPVFWQPLSPNALLPALFCSSHSDQAYCAEYETPVLEEIDGLLSAKDKDVELYSKARVAP